MAVARLADSGAEREQAVDQFTRTLAGDVPGDAQQVRTVSIATTINGEGGIIAEDGGGNGD